MTQLRQALTRFDLTMIAIGSTIGSGIFLTPSIIAQVLPHPLWILGVWVLGGALALAGALTFAELAGLMPRAGGVYVYLTEAYGGLTGFLFGWAYFLVVNTGGIAALCVAFATYFVYFADLDPHAITLVAVAGLAFVTLVNIVGVKMGGIFSDVFTIAKLAAILGIIAVGLGWGSSSTTHFTQFYGILNHGLSGGLAIAMVSVLWSCGGWQHASFASSEVKDPQRNVPYAMVMGAAVVVVLYILTNIAYFFLLDPAQVASSSRVAADAVWRVLGPTGGRIISVAIFVSTFATAGIYTLTAPRIYYAMARDGVFFKKVGNVHKRFQTPTYAILLQSGWTIVLILFWGTFENLISYVVFTDWIFFGLAGASVIVLRKRNPQAERTYKTFGYPFTPLFFVAVSCWFVVNTLIERPQQAWAGLGLLALGLPVYYYWRQRGHSWNPT